MCVSACGELVDRVVVARDGRVAAAIFRRHGEVRRHFLRGADRVDERLAVAQRAAAAFVERVRRVDQLAVVRDQPSHAVRPAALFVGGQREDDVAVGNVVFLLEAQQRGDEDRRHRLVVTRAAAVVVAVALREDEWIEVGRPVLLERRHDVEVREEQERFATARARAVVSDDDVALIGPRAALEDVGLRKPRVAESLRHRIRRDGRAADGVDGVDLDQLFVDVVRELLLRAERRALLILGGERGGKSEGSERDRESHRRLRRGWPEVYDANRRA